MPPPFPGMDPYLEQDTVWQDFHQSFLPLAREVLAQQVRPAYVVRIEEQLYIHELPVDQRALLGRADVAVSRAKSSPAPSRGTATLVAPAYANLRPVVDVERHSYLEIRDRGGQELVTVLELLSPSNKRPGSDREQYLAERREILQSPAHLVEIDLLRGGPRLPLEGLPDCDYYVMVARAEERPRAGVWPLRLRQGLPVIPVPLKTPDPDARLDLQAIVGRVYDAAGYADYIYRGDPQPPLHPDDAAWAREILGSPGKPA